MFQLRGSEQGWIWRKPLPNPSLNPLLLFFLEKDSVNVGFGYKTGIVFFLYFLLNSLPRKKVCLKISKQNHSLKFFKKNKQKTFVGM